MDLTARDPSKVPRCILSRFAGVSEAQAERESAGEILSVAKDTLLRPDSNDIAICGNLQLVSECCCFV
jgi:hypothetical protein